MNLNMIAAGVVGAINPPTSLEIYLSDGSQTLDDGTRAPKYLEPVTRSGQVQPLSSKDIEHLDALNIQGVQHTVFINGRVDGLIRAENKGGDIIIFPDGSQWLVNLVLEYWNDWVKVAVTQQRPTLRSKAAGLS